MANYVDTIRAKVRLERARAAAKQAARERAWLAELDGAPASAGLCYFAGNDTQIKIGFSVDVARRLGEVRRDADLDDITLFAVAHGGYHRESYYHKRFAAHRLHGEWFARCPEIDAEIAALSGRLASGVVASTPACREVGHG